MPEDLNQCLPWDVAELGPFSVARRSKTTSDWQKHANRVALKIFVLCAFFLTLTFAAGTVLWIAAEFFIPTRSLPS
jgi:hypothetical protein